jgi:hypothetical protein
MTLRLDQLPVGSGTPPSTALVAIEVGASPGVLTSFTVAELAAAGLANPMSAVGDIIIGGAAGAPTRLAIGTVGKVPTVNGSGTLIYSYIGGITTQGDLTVGGAGGVPQRLAPGTSGQVLTSTGAGSIPNWTSVLNNPMSAANDLIIGGTSGAPSRLAGQRIIKAASPRLPASLRQLL